MDLNVGVNLTICAIGILIFLVHIVDIILKKNKRNDEKWLLVFISFTAFHFAIYLIFTIIKIYYSTSPYIITFYTIFYIFNNTEVLLLFIYTLSFIFLAKEKKIRLSIVNILLFSIFVILDIINAFTGIFFYAKDGIYYRTKFMFISQGYQFIMLVIVLFVTSLNKKLNRRGKLAFAMYCFLPLLAIIFQNIFKGYAIAYLSIIIAVEVLFFFVNIQKNIDLAEEEKKNKEAQMKLMLSQIRPHFVYNSLSAISTLILIDPEQAQKSLDDFTRYLRRNLSSITETKLIPFSDELKHIEAYVSLEKLRFKNRINVNFDIKATEFNVPPLTIQPIVENAIKHGILKKIDGGSVNIKAYENDNSYIIEITDDGVGFDINQIDFSDNTHFGIQNIKYRINQTQNGNMEIISEVGIGTKVIVTFDK